MEKRSGRSVGRSRIGMPGTGRAGIVVWTLAAAAALLLAAPAPGGAQAEADERMSFFLTSVNPGHGADLGGLEGADAHCEHLAFAVGMADKEWRAYLSATGMGGVHARDRIGSGPWYNFEGVMVARDVDHLHSDDANLTKETVLSEWGQVVRGRGALFEADGDTTCDDWTSSAGDGSARVGHFDRTGGGQNPTSWNSAHGSRGCGQENLRGTGGDGLFYCFAVED